MGRDVLELVEVSPRDGLQNEPETLSTAVKLELIDRVLAVGFRRLEATSFVNPKRVPQLADADEVFAGLPARSDATFIALALNRRGFDRALAVGAREINYVFAASEGFSRANAGGSIAETLAPWPGIVADARAHGVRISATLSTAFGCPFDGEISTAAMMAVVDRILAAAPFELALADTIGVAAPTDVAERFAAVRAVAPKTLVLRAHFHNTRGTALANAVAALESGVRVLDGALGGFGGCPFAPGAAGNAASEDLLYMVSRMGFDTGLDLDAAIEAARFLASALGKPTRSMLTRAGAFPKHA